MTKLKHLAVGLACLMSASAFSQTSKKSFDYDAAVDKLTTYSTVIGRAVACGADVKPHMNVIQDWFDNGVPRKHQNEFNSIFNMGVLYAAKQQMNGDSPDDCSKVKSSFAKIPLSAFKGN